MEINKDLNFSEFKAPSDEEIIKVVKGRNPDADIAQWHFEPGLSFDPYYRDSANHVTRNEFLNEHHPIELLIRQDFESTLAEVLNKRIHDALMNGVNAIGLDLRTLHSNDLAKALNGVEFEHIDVALKVEKYSDAEPFLNWLGDNKLKNGMLSFDPITEWVNDSSSDLEGQFHKAYMNTVQHTNRRLKSIHADAARYRNAGMSLIQETAIALALGNEYLCFKPRTMEAQAVASALHFSFSAGAAYFPEMARLRAFRIMWQSILDQHQVTGKAFITSSNSTVNTTGHDAENNLLRNTSAAMAAIIGGCDALHLDTHNELIEPESVTSLRLARNIQLMLNEEAHITRVKNIGAGSHYVESLTSQIIDASWKLFQQIEAVGGLIKFVESGDFKSMLESEITRRTNDFNEGNEKLVGVNLHHQPTEIAFRDAKESEGQLAPFQLSMQMEEELSQKTANSES